MTHLFGCPCFFLFETHSSRVEWFLSVRSIYRVFFSDCCLHRVKIIFIVHVNFYCSSFLQGQLVNQNVSWGIIISTRSLVLQRVARYHSGNYHCSATNDRGENQSALVYLRIHCKYSSSMLFLFEKKESSCLL